MFKTQKHVFWEALLVTILIFGIGILAGVVLENWRTGQIDYLYKISEVNLLDVKLQNEIYSNGDFNCSSAIRENINFANRIYGEAKQLERYQQASVLTEDLQISHEKYDLLRAMLLLNSLQIKQACNASYYDVVYFYKFKDPNPDVIAKEKVFSSLLGELKDKKGDEVLLIPIAADNNITSIKLILDNYNITQNELPVVLINGKTKVNQIENINDLLKYFK